MSTLKHLRSSVSNKRPTASGLADGQLGINTASGTPGLYFKSTASGIVKVGPAHVGTTAPNNSPAGSAGNSTGEFWVDNSLTTHGLKYYTGSTFYNLTPSGTTSNSGLVELATNAETQAGSDTQRAVTPASLQSKVSDSTSTTSSTIIASSTAVKSAYDLANAALPKAGGTVTGELLLAASGSLVFEGSVDDGFETTLAVTNPTADRTITLPDVTGTVVTTGDTGSVTSTMIANDTIVNADINSAANIAFSKLATGALPSGITVNSSNIVDGSIVNADINATAAIVGTKISPNFGSQTIATTGRIGVGTTSPTTNVQLTSSAPTATIGNIYIAPTTAGQARYQLYNNGAVAEWILGQKTSTNHDFVLSKSVAGSESDYLIIDTSGNVNFQGTGTRIRNGRIIDCSGSTDSLTLYGGNNDGANIELYGGSHATNADLVAFDAGEHRFRSADALTERARIDSSGRLLIGTSTALGVGTTTSASLLIETTTGTLPAAFTRNDASATGPILSFGKSRGTTAGSLTAVANGDILGELRFAGADGTTRNSLGAQIQARVDGNPATGDMPGRLVFGTTPSGSAAPVERMRIRSDGGIGFGGTGSASVSFYNQRNITGGTTAYANYVNADALSDVTSTAYAHATSFGTIAASFTLGNLVHYNASQATIGAGSTVTNQYGFNAASTISGATNNYGFYSNLASAAGRWNFYANGTADSYFASNNFIFANGGTEKARFDSSGRLLHGSSTVATVGGITAGVQLNHLTTSNGASISIARYNNDAGATTLKFAKSRNTTTTPGVIVQNNDIIADIDFLGDDGNTLNSNAVRIRGIVDGAPASGSVPGALSFWTTPLSGASPLERLRITSSGFVGINTTSPAARLDIAVTGSDTEILRFSTERSWSWLQTSSGATTGIGFKDNTGAKNFTILSSTNDINTRFISSNVDSANNRVYFHEATAGRVGIGNGSANGTLHVTAASGVSPFIAAGLSSEFARIDSSGRLLVGTSSAFSTGAIQVTGGSYNLGTYTADAGASTFVFVKSRSTTPGQFTSVALNDQLGGFLFQGAEGSALATGASIYGRVDGTPATGSVPGRLVFSTTADGASSPTERMRITSDGKVGIGTGAPGTLLHLQQDAGATYLRFTANSALANGDQTITIQAQKAGVAYHDLKIDAGNHIWHALGTERLRLDSSGRLLVGASSSQLIGTVESAVQLVGVTSYQNASQLIAHYRSDNGGPLFRFYKSRGTSAGTHTAVIAGDSLGRLHWYGADGTAPVEAARIDAQVDGTPALNSMPGRLVFSTTADGASSSTERMRITSSGLVAYDQPVPLTRNTSTTLTVADLKTKIIVSAPASGITLTLPSGGLLEADFPSIYTGVTFDWSIINTSATNAITLASGVGHTIVGSGGVAPNVSARFTTRRTATSNTFISYRLC